MSALTPREREVLLLSALGLNVAEMAAELGLSENTVKVEKRLMRTRLGARNSAQAVVMGLVNSEITLDDIQAAQVKRGHPLIVGSTEGVLHFPMRD